MANKQKTATCLDDPVVQEVREARRRLVEEAGGTVEGLMKLVKAESEPAPRGTKPKTKSKS